jgi:hypothetical protein
MPKLLWMPRLRLGRFKLLKMKLPMWLLRLWWLPKRLLT